MDDTGRPSLGFPADDMGRGTGGGDLGVDIVQFLSNDGCFLCVVFRVSVGTFSTMAVAARDFAPKS